MFEQSTRWPAHHGMRSGSATGTSFWKSAIVVLASFCATPALPADLFASPTGTPQIGCTDAANPCDLGDALAAAAAGDRVHVAAGFYSNLMYSFTLPSVTIIGAGSATTTIRSGTDKCAIHYTNADVVISDLTIGGGVGCCHQSICLDVPDGASASLSLARSVIQAGNDGLEGIKVTTTGNGTASVHVVDSTIMHNGATGISFNGNGTLSVDRSLIEYNGASIENGIGGINIANVTSATISNSTIYSNSYNSSDTVAGGGIHSDAAALLRLSNVTLANNSVYFTVTGSEIYAQSASLDHSIISGTCAGTSLSGSYSVESPGHTCSLSGNSLSDQSAGFLDLGPLADNGGPTQTMKPQPDSVAIGLGGPLCQPVDQRDYIRTGACDAGAVQAGANVGDTIFANAFDVP
jgi:hypothetical protein